MESRKLCDEVIDELERIGLEMRKLQVKQNRILTDEAERLHCDPNLWQFNPNLYVFTRKGKIIEHDENQPPYCLDQ